MVSILELNTKKNQFYFYAQNEKNIPIYWPSIFPVNDDKSIIGGCDVAAVGIVVVVVGCVVKPNVCGDSCNKLVWWWWWWWWCAFRWSVNNFGVWSNNWSNDIWDKSTIVGWPDVCDGWSDDCCVAAIDVGYNCAVCNGNVDIVVDGVDGDESAVGDRKIVAGLYGWGCDEAAAAAADAATAAAINDDVGSVDCVCRYGWWCIPGTIWFIIVICCCCCVDDCCIDVDVTGG